jgi:hypothetical protein
MPFTYNGKTYTDSEVRAAAEQSNLSIDEYTQKVGLEFSDDSGKTTPQVPGAPVEQTTAPDMELSSVNISLDLASFKDQRTQDILSGYNKSTELTQEELDDLKSKYEDPEELQNQAENLRDLKARNYMQGLDDDDRLYAKEALTGVITKKRQEFDTSKFVFDETLKQAGFEITDTGIQLSKDSQFSKDIKQLENMQSALRSARAKGQEPSQQFFDDYNNLSKSIQSQQQNLTAQFQKVKESFEKNISAYSQVGAATDIVDNFQRNWSEFDKTTQEFAKFLMSSSAAIFEFAENGYVIAKANGIGPAPVAGLNAQIAINTKDAVKDKGIVQNFLAKNAQGLTDASVFLGDKIESEYYKKLTWEQATTKEAKADYVIDTLLSNLPNTVAAISGLGMPAMFFSAAGENIANNARLDKQAEIELPYLKDLLEKATTQEEKDAINARIKDFENHLSSDEATRFLVATGYGVFEAATEKLFGDIALVDWIKKGGVAPNVLKNRLGKYVSTFVFSQGMEVTGEEINTVAGNIMESQILGKDVNIFDGVKETAIDSFIIGTGYGSVGNVSNLTGRLVEVTQTKARKKKFTQIHNDIKSLGEQLKNENLTSKEKKEIRSKMRGKAKELALETEFNLEQLGRFNSKELFELGESDRKLKELRRKALAIALSNKSKEQKEAEINEINDQYSVEAEAKENFILQNTGKTSRLRKQKIDKNLNDYISTASRINQLGADQQAAMSKEFAKLGIEIQFAENQEQANEIVQKSKKLSAEEKQSMSGNAAIFGNDKLIVINTSGSIADIIQNKSAFAGSVVRHEVLHGILFKSFDNSKIQEIGKKLEDHARAALQNGDTRYQEIVDRIDAYRNAKNKDNTPRFSEAVVLEEAWNAYSDVISDPGKMGSESINVVKDKTLLEEVKNEFNNFISLVTGKPVGDLRLDTAEDAIQFLSDYNKSFTKGQLSKGVKLALKKKGFKPVKTTAAKESLSADDKTNMMNLYNKFMEGVERTEYSKNKPLPARLENELVGKFYNYVNTVVNNQFKQVEEEAIEKEDAVAILMGEVVNAIRTFNPAKNNDIAGYVANIIGRRKSMVFQDVNQEFTDDVETSKEAQTVLEEVEQVQETVQKEANKETLLEAIDVRREVEGKTYEEHVIDAIAKNARLAIKVYGEEVSANRTVTPFVARVKEGLAEDLRQITKKFINEYGYEAFLKDHKKVILQNFTTTYLSKHPLFRKGIEKSIGGKMVKDNQGNPMFEPNWTLPTETKANKFEWVDSKGNKAKIDRDNAGVRGLTSGPEIIRRSKKINSIISDNEFIDYHFQDGALRKKKKQNPEDALARQIAAELGFDLLKQDLNQAGPISEQIQEVSELYDKVLAETELSKIARDIDRGTVKLSLSSDNTVVAAVAQARMSEAGAIELLNKSIAEIAQESEYLADVLFQGTKSLKGDALVRKVLFKAMGKAVAEAKTKNEKAFIIQEFLNTFRDPIRQFSKEEDKKKVKKGEEVYGLTLLDTLIKEISDALPTADKDILSTDLNSNAPLIYNTKNGELLYNGEAVKYGVPKGMDVTQEGNRQKFIKGFDNISPQQLKSDWKKTNAEARERLERIVFEIGALNPDAALAIIEISNQAGKGFFRLSAEINAVVQNYDGKTDYEHNPPLNHVAEKIKDFLYNQTPAKKQELKQLFDTMEVNIVPKDFHETVNDKYRTTTPTDGTLRYADALAKHNYEFDTSTFRFSISSDDKTRMNDMVSETAKVTKAEISEATATRMAKNKGKFRFYIPPSADDFAGLMYYMLRKGDLGDADMQFIKEKLLDPFAKNHAAWESYRLRKLNEFRDFKKLLRNKPKAKLSAKNDVGFTNEDAIRVWLWDKKGTDLGNTITAIEKANLIEIVETNPDLLQFAQSMSNLFGGAKNYPDPSGNWFNGSITIDVIENINEHGRKTFFETFNNNAEELFGKMNDKGEISGPMANKLRAAYGNNYVESLSDILYRMKNGRSREFGKNRLMNQFNNWISNSVGAVMFFNTRSAILQQVSMINFINLSDNNPLKVGKALADPKQYWSDYLYLINSDFLVSRRDGVKIDVNQDEIAKAAESGKNPVQSVISLILKKGFALTTWGDSNAIAMGGAAFYRNRVNTYINDGLSKAEAESKAFMDFKEIAEESQQSSRPDRISQQQASTLGRVILAWANTPMQYARLTKKATLDLINGRGDWKTNMSKIIYYGAVQNLMFTYMQQGLFAMIFDGEDDEEKDADKWEFTFNSMADGFLRGLGFGGAVVSTAKNMVLEAIEQSKGRKNYDEVVWEALKLSPPLGSKIAKARAVGRTFGWKQEREKVFTEGWSLNNPAFEAIGKGVSATTNIPLDRVVRKLDNITYPVRHEVEFWQAAALYLGWGQWELGLKETKKRNKQKHKYKTQKGSTLKYK